MTLDQLASEIRAFTLGDGGGLQLSETGVKGLMAFASTETTRCEATIYHPTFCLVLQGRKEAVLGGKRMEYGAGDAVVVSHSVPLEAGIIDATEEAPFASLVLQLDLGLMRSLSDEVGETAFAHPEMQSMNIAKSDAALIDAMARLFRMSHSPLEVRALAPLVMREIHFRLLCAPNGGMLRQLLWHESPASRVSKALALIRERFSSPIAVAELADVAGMSPSAFHDHFKSLTGTTPLRYQKDLRLLEARLLLQGGTSSVSGAAFAVGYESPAQFSREYARKFGVSPRDDKSGMSTPVAS